MMTRTIQKNGVNFGAAWLTDSVHKAGGNLNRQALGGPCKTKQKSDQHRSQRWWVI